MRILHFNQFGTHVGGAEGYIADVSAALAQAGHASFLVHFSPADGADLIPDTRHAPLPEWPDPPHQAIQIIEQVIASFRPDIAYLHAVYHPALIRWIAHRLPTVAYVHGPYPVCPGSGQYLRRSERACTHRAGIVCLVNAQTEGCCWGRSPLKHVRLLRRGRAFAAAYDHIGAIFVGSGFMRKLLQQGRIPSEKLTILPPVLFEQPFPSPTDPGDSRTIFFAGRLVREKGLHHLIEVLPSLDADWRLVVAGDGPERERCQRLAAKLGVAERVLFAGWLGSGEVARFLSTCACVAVPSLVPEAYGRVGPEAFRHGRPVVAYDSGGISDWLEHGRSGYLVAPGDIKGLGECLRDLVRSYSLRRAMGEYARNRAFGLWDAATHVAQFLDMAKPAASPLSSNCSTERIR